jgi:hypothetical protein
MRDDGSTFKPGFGGGISFAYWEYEYWFIKAGIDYHFMSSSARRFADNYDVIPSDPEDKIDLDFTEQTVGIPLAAYFRPFESGENTMLVVAKMEAAFVVHLKESSEEFGEVVRKGSEIKTRMKTNVGLGVGYQRQLDRYMYLNVYPSFNLDVRGDQAFNSITLTVELLYGVY